MTTSLFDRLERLNEIGISLSAEKDNQRLLERILESAKELTNADGGTLYLCSDDNKLEFSIMLTDSLGIHLGGTSGEKISLKPLPLYDENDEANHHMVAAHAALVRQTINIPDAYEAEHFDFSGPRGFDEKMGYRSTSFLTVPMLDHDGANIGVLQLINALDADNAVVPFTLEDQKLVESLSSQAAVTLTNKRLIDGQKRLFESFIELIASAIDDKSPYTGGHCRRVPELTMLLADAAAKIDSGPLADFTMSEDDRYELRIAGWLHDCGKVTTPEYVVDKGTKLETLSDRMRIVDTRFEVLKRDVEIRLLRDRLMHNGDSSPGEIDAALARELGPLDDEREFLRRMNVGGEFMTRMDQARVHAIGARRWRDPDGYEANLLSDDEIYNLNIPKGTLTPEERSVINHHIVATIKMLEALPYPAYLRNVPEYAGGHHERMDGKGYPRGLTGNEMSVQARVMGIADIFEALTARDRPYKKGMTLCQALTILGRMKEDNHVDPDLFDVFIRQKVYLDYAREFLGPDQIDAVDDAAIPGYIP